MGGLCNSHNTLIPKALSNAHFGSIYTKIGMTQRRVLCPLFKDDTQSTLAILNEYCLVDNKSLSCVVFVDFKYSKGDYEKGRIVLMFQN